MVWGQVGPAVCMSGAPCGSVSPPVFTLFPSPPRTLECHPLLALLSPAQMCLPKASLSSDCLGPCQAVWGELLTHLGGPAPGSRMSGKGISTFPHALATFWREDSLRRFRISSAALGRGRRYCPQGWRQDRPRKARGSMQNKNVQPVSKMRLSQQLQQNVRPSTRSSWAQGLMLLCRSHVHEASCDRRDKAHPLGSPRVWPGWRWAGFGAPSQGWAEAFFLLKGPSRRPLRPQKPFHPHLQGSRPAP